MGEHSAIIEIRMSLHGVKRYRKFLINYDGYDGVDPRIVEFFEEVWQAALAKYHKEQHD